MFYYSNQENKMIRKINLILHSEAYVNIYLLPCKKYVIRADKESGFRDFPRDILFFSLGNFQDYRESMAESMTGSGPKVVKFLV